MPRTDDELAIRDLNARYIDAVNRNDKDAWAATWSETGSWDLMGMETSGRDQILQFWLGAMSSFDFAVMMLNSGTLQIDGDNASGRWYMTEHLKSKEGNPEMVLGVYDDRYRREDGHWLFAERRYRVLYRAPTDASGEYTPYAGEA